MVFGLTEKHMETNSCLFFCPWQAMSQWSFCCTVIRVGPFSLYTDCATPWQIIQRGNKSREGQGLRCVNYHCVGDGLFYLLFSTEGLQTVNNKKLCMLMSGEIRFVEKISHLRSVIIYRVPWKNVCAWRMIIGVSMVLTFMRYLETHCLQRQGCRQSNPVQSEHCNTFLHL